MQLAIAISRITIYGNTISGHYLRFRSVAPNRLTNYATARECNYLVRLKMINDAGEGDVTTLTDRMVLQKR